LRSGLSQDLELLKAELRAPLIGALLHRELHVAPALARA
jgi:hypothetical protein